MPTNEEKYVQLNKYRKKIEIKMEFKYYILG